jgi:hypothetical protein
MVCAIRAFVRGMVCTIRAGAGTGAWLARKYARREVKHGVSPMCAGGHVCTGPDKQLQHRQGDAGLRREHVPEGTAYVTAAAAAAIIIAAAAAAAAVAVSAIHNAQLALDDDVALLRELHHDAVRRCEPCSGLMRIRVRAAIDQESLHALRTRDGQVGGREHERRILRQVRLLNKAATIDDIGGISAAVTAVGAGRRLRWH